MKTAINRNRNRIKRKSKNKAKESLLGNVSPPLSPTVWVAADDDMFSTVPSTFSLALSDMLASESTLRPMPPPPSTDTRVPPESRFYPQHEPRKGLAPVDVLQNKNIQFSPAYSESVYISTTPTKKQLPARTFHNSPSPAASTSLSSANNDTSWDAVIEADDNSSKGGRARSFDGSISSTGTEEKKTPRMFRRSKQKANESKDNNSPSKQSQNEEATSTVSGSSSKRGPRMARLASLFSSRSVNKGGGGGNSPTRTATTKAAALKAKAAEPKKKVAETQKKTSKTTPISPSRSSQISSGSSGYIGWPGTQDKRGKTIAIESSYDDSSIGAAAFHRKNFEEELEAAADLEMHRWMTEDEQSLEDSLTTPQTDKKPMHTQQKPNNVSSRVFHDEVNENVVDSHMAVMNAYSKSSKGKSSKAIKTNGHNRTSVIRHNKSKPLAPASVAGSRIGSESVAATSASGTLSIHNLFGSDAGNRSHQGSSVKQADPWDVDSSSQPPSSPGTGTSISKDSSAFFHTKDMNSPAFPSFGKSREYGVRRNIQGAASVMRRKTGGTPVIQKLSREALETNNHLTPPPRVFNAHNVRGYPGFLDKTKDVPNLMDDDSDSLGSSITKSTAMHTVLKIRNANKTSTNAKTTRKKIQNGVDDDSDVFDGLSQVISDNGVKAKAALILGASRSKASASMGKTRADNQKNGLRVVKLGKGLATIQTSKEDYENRQTPSDFDENLTNSEVNQYGFTRTPGFSEMVSSRRQNVENGDVLADSISKPRVPIREPSVTKDKSIWDSSFRTETTSEISNINDSSALEFGHAFSGDLSHYRVRSSQSKALVKMYRKFCKIESSRRMTIEEHERLEDSKKAFALSEMRCRIMEKDLERGLERQGGTVVVDDLVMTSYFQARARIRDAVIVSKAWRDGASPRDVITASKLTRREERTYFVKRPLRRGYRTMGRKQSNHDDASSVVSDYSYTGLTRSYVLEEIDWTDDIDFLQMRCPSLGPGNMRGFEMFTIGDCQSILLKLTNEQCMNIRYALNLATARQIEAEEIMKMEGDAGDGIMTESEIVYLSSMERVKILSKKLVLAERSFNLVKERIQKLMARYEAMILKIENDSVATASVVTYDESSFCSDYNSEEDYSSDEEDEREREVFQRRAQRAELRAELAAREAILAKQQAKKIQEEKEREIEILQQRLAELQSESSSFNNTDRSRSLAKVIATKKSYETASQGGKTSPLRMSKEQINGVKQRFRDRMANRMRQRSDRNLGGYDSESGSSAVMSYGPPRARPPTARLPVSLRSQRRMLVGEEMYQHLDFYERSLQAVS